ncbi:periplasmic heavy metal sensor [Desulfonema magnum]|uniref:Metal-binding domain-containing protein n=1 Tax=Desulfonema magnum TaxID=45655 RepID=A0A975GRN3_9BACT|nr:periplasmic heavy metal sensor [Desulfonema magnum]QTA90178.1 Metal-binding domain-containing protein [Desulfonema magnum]
MKKNYVIRWVMALALIAMTGFGANAFADWGMGYGGCPGKRFHAQSRYGGPSWMADLSADEIKKAEEERSAFFTATEDIRQNIYEKKLELKSVMAKKTPDVEKAKTLQKELSEYKARLDMKRLEHIIRMKKINPYLGRGFLEGKFRGRGFGCMNCPMNTMTRGKGYKGKGYGKGSPYGMTQE